MSSFAANSYTITLSTGNTLGTVTDISRQTNTVNLASRYDSTLTSLKLVRRGAVHYSDITSENMVHMLENFSSSSAPTQSLVGQLWFDSAANTLKVKNTAGTWQAIAYGSQILPQGLAHPVSITLSGAVTGTTSFDGINNVNINTTLTRPTDGNGNTVTPTGTYNLATITVDQFGRITAASSNTIPSLGYTPVNKGGDTMSGSLTINTGNLNVVSGKVQEGGNALLPSGAIIMWSGTTIPAGWKLCNGTNGTPNLVDRFIMGSAGASSTGGNNSLGLTTSAAGGHGHTGSSDTQGGHSHGGATSPTALTTDQMPTHQHITSFGESTDNTQWGNDGTGPHNFGSYGYKNNGVDYDNYRYMTSPTGGGQGHSHVINSDGSHSHNITLNAVGDHTHSFSFDNRPAYYTLAFIMKI